VLFSTPRLTDPDQVALVGIDEMRDRLRHQVRDRPGKGTSGLRKFLTADAVAASNSIEGFRVSTQDVQDLMDGERDVDVSDENREETLAYQRMMTYVQSLHDVADFEYSKSLLNALHWMLQGHRHTRNKPAGQWRAGPVYVTDPRDPLVAAYTAPNAADVSGLTAELVAWLNTPDGAHPLIRAAMAHLHLVSIHPWADGNGRMSRSLQTLLIAREGVLAPEFSSIEAWLGRPGNTWEYYRELQAQTVQHRMDRSAAVWELLASFAGDAGLDERVVSALHDVAVGGRVRRTRYEQAEGLTLQQAQRDLRDLATAGLLAPVGRTRARYYTEGPRFPAPALELARTPFTLTSPYPND
jgi:Fic family protein